MSFPLSSALLTILLLVRRSPSSQFQTLIALPVLGPIHNSRFQYQSQIIWPVQTNFWHRTTSSAFLGARLYYR